MPSCCVKNCKNRSDAHKKKEGITFHRFPTNELWKTDWVEIIRKTKNDNNWKPSKTSVICSSHFAPNDIYKTKGGLLRIVTYAVPKKQLFLDRRRQKRKKEMTVIFSSFPTQEIKPVILPEIPIKPQQINADEDDDASNDADEDHSTQDDEVPSDEASSSEKVYAESKKAVKKRLKQENMKGKQHLTNESAMVPIVATDDFNASTHQVFDPLNIIVKQEQTTSDVPNDTANGECENDNHNGESPNGFNSILDALLSDLQPIRRIRIKEHITNVQNTIKGQRAKIKMLNQRIRRLEVRNKTLKAILKKVTVIKREKTGCKLPKGIYQTDI